MLKSVGPFIGVETRRHTTKQNWLSLFQKPLSMAHQLGVEAHSSSPLRWKVDWLELVQVLCRQPELLWHAPENMCAPVTCPRAHVCTRDISRTRVCTHDISWARVCTYDISRARVCTCDISRAHVCTCDISLARVCNCDISQARVCSCPIVHRRPVSCWSSLTSGFHILSAPSLVMFPEPRVEEMGHRCPTEAEHPQTLVLCTWSTCECLH